jgi:hypothetical protein
MKFKLLVVLVILGLSMGTVSLFAGGGAESTESTAKDVLAMSWDDLVATAKQEGQVALYVWYKQDYFVDALNAFKQKYGINAQRSPKRIWPPAPWTR